MGAPLTRAQVAEAALAWVGTPYVTGAALRGCGADCVGLVRGLYRETTGRELPPPPGWRRDWASGPGRPLVDAARRHLEPIPLEEARPGDVIGFRMGRLGRLAHCGVLVEGGRVVHAVEGVGVIVARLAPWRGRLAFAARFPGLE